MAVKLTKAELALLKRIEVEEQACAYRAGSAAHGLWLADLAEWNDRAGAGLWWLKITPAGRQALQEQGS